MRVSDDASAGLLLIQVQEDPLELRRQLGPGTIRHAQTLYHRGAAAQCYVAGGHSIDDPEPKYGMAVTGTADPAALLRIDAGQPGLSLGLTKPIGTGVLNAA
jgi:selenophosphate synthase